MKSTTVVDYVVEGGRGGMSQTTTCDYVGREGGSNDDFATTLFLDSPLNLKIRKNTICKKRFWNNLS